jgi:hypothetical protein
MAEEYYFVACPGVLGVRTNFRDFKWSFGTSMPADSREKFADCDVRLRVEITSDFDLTAEAEPIGKYHYWMGNQDEDYIRYSRDLFFGKKLLLEAKGLLSQEPYIRVNRNYMRFVTHRFMNLHSLGYILTDLASLLLLRKGYAPLHCSAFQSADSTVVIAAPPNTGKTLTSVSACMHHGARYIAEDLAVTDGTNIMTVPWTSTFRYYKDIDNRLGSRLRAAATKLIPPIELLTASRTKPITEYIQPDSRIDRARATHLVVLERGDERIEPINATTAFTKIRNLNRYEFNYHRSPLVIAHEFFNPQLGIEDAYQAEASLLQQLVINVDKRLVVTANNPTRYSELILQELGVRNTETSLLRAA